MIKKFLVTGSSGFIASHVSDFLSSKGYEVILLDKKKSLFKKKNQKMIIGDFKKSSVLKRSTKNIDTVFHFAATADLKEADENPFYSIDNNIFGTIKLLKACVKNKVKKFVYASSIYAISEQGGIYSTTKLSSEMLIEKLCAKFNIKYVILRFGTVYGDRANKFNTVENFINDAQKKLKIFRETKGNEVRRYIHVKDVAKIVFESTKKKYENGYYNIFGNKKIVVRNLLDILKSKLPNLKVKYSKYEKKKYNYKINPFTYRLRKGKNFKLKKYISIENGISELLKNNKL